ncbi:DUF3526 domain-containing protein [Flagellimonas flava]|uniref:ABC-2 type transport system permease protein n=1 Tax=Flagellimonas flava TaxID=570519 RepID=A0A1M5IZ24_9FLAO|nr:DUF3526 domain-containing protein [Allomuricauda flava]SHG33385.1 ABC-2 type transport system permease protein [Allomuricauda flava]
MYQFNSKYELKSLLRNGWIQLMTLLLLGLFLFAFYNGNEKVDKRKNDIQAAFNEVKESDQNMLILLDSVQRGMEVSASRWTIPTKPMAVGNYHPRVAAMNPGPLAFVATGQSDLFSHYIKPKASGDDMALNFTEISNPVQQLFGSFDLAFVIIYLLPLIIIAFTYNVLSSEKESGTLRLLASQPISMRSWVFQKMGIRLFWVVLMIGVVLILVSVIIPSGVNIVELLPVFGVTLGYIFFWFALAFAVNLWVGSSSKNAIALIGLWLVFVLLIPSVLNQMGNALYPMPSRTLMINEMRSAKAEATKKQDQILDNFLRDHPEYAINDPNQNRSFYHRYMASQQLVREELQPVVGRFEQQLQNQQQWISQLKWISPAIIVQQELNALAGSSTKDYENYRKQVTAFAESWRQHLLPFLYSNEPFSTDDYENLPEFQYQRLTSDTTLISIIALVFIALIGVILGFLKGVGSQSTEKFITQ